MEGDKYGIDFKVRRDISIHALRVEGDEPEYTARMDELIFLSTPSGWRATAVRRRKTVEAVKISIHALRVEGDSRHFLGSV